MAKTILCVIRTSTIRQELESQKVEMIGFIQSLGYNEDEIEWLEAKGASARKVNDEYLQMLATLKQTIISNPTIKAAAFWHLNRLGRIEKYIVEMKEWFVNNHIQVYVRTPQLTLLDREGKLDAGANIAWGVFGSMVAYDTQEMMEKFHRGKSYAKDKGKYVGGFVPFGFKVEDHKMIVDDSQMSLVIMLFQEYATGRYSYDSLNDEMRSRGYNFTIRHIHLLLTKEIYKPYVGEELWNKVKDVREGNTLNTKETKYCHLANRLIKCIHCGGTYIADGKVYKCINNKHHKRTGVNCPNSISISCDVLDTILWDYASFFHRNYLANKGKDSIREYEQQIEVIHQKLYVLHNDTLPKVHSKMNRIKELYIEGALSRKDYDDRISDCHLEINKIETNSKAYSQEINRLSSLIERIKNNSFEDYSLLMATVGDITKANDMREVVRQHIRLVNIDKIDHNNRTCILIIIYPVEGEPIQLIYDFNGDKKRKGFLHKIYKNNGDRYNYSGKPFSQVMKEAFEDTQRIIETQKEE